MKFGVVFISGFTETERLESGMDQIHREIDHKYKQHPDVEVYDLRTWKADMKGLAALMVRDGITHAIINAYSHGGGYASPRLSGHLIRSGIIVLRVNLCDPVYRPLWLPCWTIAQALAVRALIPGSAVITFPHGVRSIRGVRQSTDIPQAHKVRIGKGDPFHVRWLGGEQYRHGNIDNSEEWRDLVRQSLTEIIGT